MPSLHLGLRGHLSRRSKTRIGNTAWQAAHGNHGTQLGRPIVGIVAFGKERLWQGRRV